MRTERLVHFRGRRLDVATGCASGGAETASEPPWLGSNTTQENQDEEDDQDDSDDADAAVPVAVTVAAETAAKATKQKYDEDDNQNESKRHQVAPRCSISKPC